MPIETEIKLAVLDPQPILDRIAALGYLQRGERQLEQDQLFDQRNGELRSAGQTLRIRTRGDRSTLTYKGPRFKAALKSREEIELDLSDGPAFILILAALGYYPSFAYEKFRTTFAKAGEPGIITLDETPIGSFLELEGDADWIDKTAEALGFSAVDYMTQSYAGLYRKFCQTNPGATYGREMGMKF